MRRFLGEDENQPIRHPQIISDVAPRIMGVPLRNHPGHRRCNVDPFRGMSHGVQLLLDVRHVRRQRKVHRVLQDRRRTLRDHVCVGVEPARQRLLRHGRELPVEQAAGAPTAGLDGEARQAVESESLQLRRRAAAIHDGATGRPGSRLGVAWPGGQGFPYGKLAGTDTHGPGPIAAIARDPRARLEHHRPRGAHAGKHGRSHRLCRPPQHRLPPVHALHAHPGHALVRRTGGERHAARALPKSRWRTFTDS